MAYQMKKGRCIMKFKREKIVWCFFMTLLMCQTDIWAKTTDTALVAMFSKSFFFNVLENGEGKIFAGSSDGIYELSGMELKPVDSRSGYVMLEHDGSLSIDPKGLGFAHQSTLLHLLPFPDVERNEFHATHAPYLYIVSGGRLYVFEIKPFGHILKEQSVRTISPHFTGTYSGIYYRGKRLPTPAYPGFTDGYIREYKGKVFIPFEKLNVYSFDDSDSALHPVPDIPEMINQAYVYDVRYSATTEEYFVFTERQVFSMDSGLNKATLIHIGDSLKGPLVLTLMQKHFLLFAQGTKLLYFDLYGRKTRDVGTLPEPVMDGAENGLSWYILCPSGLYVYNSTDIPRKILSLNRAHTLLANRDGEFIIGTDVGLMHYNIKSRSLSTLIKGVEFNRRALALVDDRVHAGSINGLYLLDNDRIQEIIRLNDKPRNVTGAWPGWANGLLILLIAATFLMAILYLRTRRKYVHLVEETVAAAPESAKSRLTREEIENFIRSNLSLASLKSIKERFQTNHVQVYNLLAPEKPGSFIHRLRMEILMEMKAKGASSYEIAQKTGLSESYVRKIWNKA
jgi:hypothetical protein